MRAQAHHGPGPSSLTVPEVTTQVRRNVEEILLVEGTTFRSGGEAGLPGWTVEARRYRSRDLSARHVVPQAASRGPGRRPRGCETPTEGPTSDL